MKVKRIALILGLLLFGAHALGTPSTTYWAPSTASCQPWRVLHVTYDTYFGRGPTAGTSGAPTYPVDTGLTVGFLPGEKIQGEFGYDLLLPTDDPLLLNGKLCTPENTFFEGSPALSFGVFDFGFRKDINDYDVLYLMMQKALPWGGYVALGAYRGTSTNLFTNSDGDLVQTGMMAAIASPDIKINKEGLKKIVFVADVQTGKNSLGGGGIGSYIYFTDRISLLAGPVWFFDRALQPGQRSLLWTAQLDVDIPF